MPKDQFSDLRVAYAKAKGCDRRTAQRHQKGNHPDWQRFLGRTASEGVRKLEKAGKMEPAEVVAFDQVSPMRPPEEVVDEDEDVLHPVQIAERRARRTYQEVYKKSLAYLAAGMTASDHTYMAIARELPALRNDWVKARAELEKWELGQRMLIPAHEFEAFVGQFLVPLAEVLRNLPTELPIIANPENPGLARGRILEWVRSKVEPQIQGMLEGSQEFLAA